MNENKVEFQGYSVSRLEMEKITSNKKNEDGNFEIKSEFFQNMEDKLSYKLVMNLDITSKTHKIYMVVEGYFKFSSKFDDKMIEEFLKVNGHMILYPYCRTLISNITNLDSANSVLLPIINFKG